MKEGHGKGAKVHDGYGRGMTNRVCRETAHKFDRQIDKRRRREDKKNIVRELEEK